MAEMPGSSFIVCPILCLVSFLLIALPSALCVKHCSGTSDGASISGHEHNSPIERLRGIYNNCHIVDGNLEIVGITPNNSKNVTSPDAFAFLENITEVFGYVYIAKNKVPLIPLPSLRVIWNLQGGFQSLPPEFRDGQRKIVRSKGLVIEGNDDADVDLRSLRVIQKGGVHIGYNSFSCYLHTIKWDEIILEAIDLNESTIKPSRGCDQREIKCDKACGEHCFGPGPDQCQDRYKKGCAVQCKGECYKVESPQHCCHHTCIGGCTGPKDTDCTACANYMNEGRCVFDCPKFLNYDEHYAAMRPNPNGRYKYKKQCVKKCPPNMLIYETACVSACPQGFSEDLERSYEGPYECKKITEKDRVKVCNIDKWVTSWNIDKFINCTVVRGHITLIDHAFENATELDQNGAMIQGRPITIDELEKLSSVTTVSEYVYIQTEYVKNLRFLRNLQSILGRNKFQQTWTLEISGCRILKELGLKSLRSVTGDLFIQVNDQLCYGGSIPWTIITTGKADVTYHFEENCERDGERCDPTCAPETGCWGKGSDMCWKCRGWKYGENCVTNCTKEEGFFEESPGICKKCDPLCAECTNSTKWDCTKCVNVRLDQACAEKCPSTHYEYNGECFPCHFACHETGCTGDKNKLGPGGCNKCLHAELNSDRKVERCLEDSEDERMVCSLNGLGGYYKRRVLPSDGTLSEQVSVSVCERCDEACVTCQAFGVKRSLKSDACNCSRYHIKSKAVDGECGLECPAGYYTEIAFTDSSIGLCAPCHDQCSKAGCNGKGPTNCMECESFRDYNDTSDSSKFTCVATCPEERKYHSDSICRGTDPIVEKQIQKKKTNVIIGAVVGGCLLLLITVSTVCFCQKRRNSQALKNLMLPPQLPLDAALNSNAKPNMARLRIIKETELRKGGLIGQGAFGSVFRGMFIPEEAHPPVKIPVALKVVGTNSNTDTTEMLEEASLMAAMDHRHLVRLVGVCVSDEIQLLTPLMPLGNLLDYVQNNKANIGSFALLTWATQIAEGMEYLEANHLVHRDLAARNVLVQMPYHVRVADFGLAKMLDAGQSEVHVEGRVPLKWLAIESIEKQIFTHKSDVWAFGVTIWELLKFGAKPYPDVRMDQVYIKIQSGQRLPQPEICSVDLYLILIRCWLLNADSRPNFKQLREILEGMLKDPPKYLSVPNDKLLRMPSVASQDEQHQLERWRNEFSVDGDVSMDYLDGSSAPTSPTSPRKPLINVGSRASPRHTSVGSRRYQKDPTERKNLPAHAEEEAMREAENSRVLPTDGENYLIPDSQQGLGPGFQSQASTYTPVLTSLPTNQGEQSYYNSNAGAATGVENLEYLQPRHSQKLPDLDLDQVVETETSI